MIYGISGIHSIIIQTLKNEVKFLIYTVSFLPLKLLLNVNNSYEANIFIFMTLFSIVCDKKYYQSIRFFFTL